jgi:hypothetical protein
MTFSSVVAVTGEEPWRLTSGTPPSSGRSREPRGAAVDDDVRAEDLGETPTVEVRVFRDGALVHRELCESAEDAQRVVDAWSEGEAVSFEVDDLSCGHGAAAQLEADLVLEPE